MACAMPKKPQKPAPTPHKLDTRAIMRPGTQLVCAMADFDAADGYQLRIDELADVLRFSYAFVDEDDEDAFDLDAELDKTQAVASAALGDAAELLFLSQGSASAEEDPEGPYTTCTPPFMVSRRVLAAIKAGQAPTLRIHGDTGRLAHDGTDSVSLKVNGEERNVTAVRARDEESGMTVWILDDDTWPLLLSAEFQGDNYVRLVSIYTRGK
jgi:hypothetical protein